MSTIINYKYQIQQQQIKQCRSSLYKQQVRVQRKQLNKKLKAIQNRPDKWVHEMDNEMLKTICQMSQDDLKGFGASLGLGTTLDNYQSLKYNSS